MAGKDRPLPSEPDKMVHFDLPASCEVIPDAEATSSSAQLVWRHRPQPMVTVADYRKTLVVDMALCALNKRLKKRAMEPVRPFTSASTGTEAVVMGLDTASLSVSAPEAELASAVQRAWAEVRKAQLYGFTKRELATVRSMMRAEMQTSWVERDQVESSSLSDEYKEQFLKGVYAPSVKWDVAAMTSLLPGITLREIKEALNVR